MVAPSRFVCYDLRMDKEPMNWGTLALAVWPLWLVLAVLGVWWLLARYGYAAPDTYEEPPPVQPNDKWMTAEERDYHQGGGFGRG